MADDSAQMPRPFDVRTIKYLVKLMGRHDLSEIDLREGELRIRLRRGPLGLPLPLPPISAVPAAPPPATAGEPPRPAEAARPLVDIKSPGPGIFYIAPKPGAEPFVRPGSKVTSTTVVGLLEAMKLFTEINAECSGVIVECLIENQQAVEWGQVLFRVDPTG